MLPVSASQNEGLVTINECVTSLFPVRLLLHKRLVERDVPVLCQVGVALCALLLWLLKHINQKL